ncbi:MAG TPA: hypothetical protein VMV95_03685 [Bacillota bacterium]|nr:hypothetical protein [Bacillota bacterium]
MDSRGNENLDQMNYKSRIMKWYNTKILKEVVNLAELKGNEKILDFGCSYQQELKKYVPNGVKYVGFDIVSAWSDVKDYRKLKGVDVVFALNVLEHMYNSQELQEHLNNFKKIGAKKIIVALPIENIIEDTTRIVLNKEAEDFFAHTMPSKQAARELVKIYGMPKKYKRVNFLQIISRFDMGVKTRNE